MRISSFLFSLLIFFVGLYLGEWKGTLYGERNGNKIPNQVADRSDVYKKDVSVDGPHRDAHIQEILSHVEEEYMSMCKDIFQGKAATFSQGWQDWMIYHNYYRDRAWGEGFYLDIGSNDAVVISNTLFFDKCLGWQGICAEPQSEYHKKIQQKRGCDLITTCVLGQDTSVTGSLAGVDFTLKETASHSESTMQCVGIESLQKKFGFRKIDLVSLDIEGMESSVLSCWPFDNVNTTMFLVETNKQDVRMVDFFFHRHGYINADSYSSSLPSDGKAHLLDNLYIKDDKQHPHPPLGSAFQCTPTIQKYMSVWCAAFAMTPMDTDLGKRWFHNCNA
mmetsp:Transcript_40660/g.84637  ORF Transcript_40660/g.84637 Transcript_40660/m.84637 type:complete len:333 (-) Transcript_40660:494-1492(-)